MQFATIGAYFLPFMVWAVIQSEKRAWRLAGLAGVLTVPVWLFLSGTRQAPIIAALATAPLLVRKGALRTLGTWLALGLVAAGVLLVAAILLGGYDTGWLLQRFMDTSLTGREMRWAAGWRVAMESPLIGRGHGSSGVEGAILGLSFHNSYLSIWINTGIFGLLCVVSVLIGQTVRAYRLMRWTTDPFVKDAAKLAFGLMLVMVAVAQIEGVFAGPSGMSIAMLLLISTLITRLHALENENAMAWLSTGYFPPSDALPIPMRYGFASRRTHVEQAGRA